MSLSTITAYCLNGHFDRDLLQSIVNYINLVPTKVKSNKYRYFEIAELDAIVKTYSSCKTVNAMIEVLEKGKRTILLAIEIHEIKPFYVTEGGIQYYVPKVVKNALELLDNYKSVTEISRNLDIGSRTLRSLLDFHDVSPVYVKGNCKYYNFQEVSELVSEFKRYKTIGEICEKFEVSRSKVESVLDSNNILPRFFDKRRVVQYYLPEDIRKEMERYKRFIDIQRNDQVKSIYQICDLLGIGKKHFYSVIESKSIPSIIEKDGVDYYRVEEIAAIVRETSNIKKLSECSDIEVHQVRKIIEDNNINPCYSSGNIKYFNHKEVEKILSKWKEERRALKKYVTTSELGEIYGIDRVKIRRYLKSQGVEPVTIVDGIKYYEDESTIEVIDLLRNVSEFKTLNELALEMKACAKTLRKAVEYAGVEPSYRMKIKRTDASLEIGLNEYQDFYEENKVIYALEQNRTQVDEKTAIRSQKQVKFFPLVHEDLQKTINKYIEYRKAGRGITYNNFFTNKKIKNPEKQLRVIKGWLSSSLYKIAEYRLKNNNEEIKKPLNFDIYTLNVEDFDAIKKVFKPSSRQTLFHIIRPFLYFLLKEKKKSMKTIEDYLSFNSLELQFDEFLNLFPRRQEEVEDIDNDEELPKKLNKSFLTREQTIDIYYFLLTDPRSQESLKNATMWLIGCVTGLRPEELLNLRIEHFELDEKGLLKVNERGWGVLRFPKEMAKQKLKGSHKIFGTPVSPYAIDLINKYLLWLYKFQGETNVKGVGWFFRPFVYLPEKKYKKISNQFIVRLREQLDFLEKEQANDFVKKASRHSMNNLFVEAFHVIPDKELKSKLEKARQHHMRHKGEDDKLKKNTLNQAKTGSEHYTDDISSDAYYGVLEYVVGYPWDKKDLVLWEAKKGFRCLEKEITINSDTAAEQEIFEKLLQEQKREREINQQEKSNSNNTLLKQLQLIDDRLLQIKHPPNSKDKFEAWRKEIVILNKEKEKIQLYLKDVPFQELG
ncbi:integrase [Bacillus pakistanensis]|uniref:Integrase n=1 Tax=Rossellomorea pakistanensis TaxID=992288 RepID=A0ABS2N7U3_9BACI|nr:site-specific integrase [Bacillus pakistanensis]MBM7583932.1 integrase [Bacillus pakistanensis]